MQKNGGLISEKQIEQSPEAKSFPERNRIIAGLCDAIIVVEAAGKSGSLITARLATEMNREVMAVPGRWLDKISQGCNQIIHEDIAHLISSPEDIENIMGWNIERKKQAPKKVDKPMRPLSNKEQKVVDFLKKQSEAHIDAISQATEIPISELSSVLLQLAIDDCIQNTNNIYSLE